MHSLSRCLLAVAVVAVALPSAAVARSSSHSMSFGTDDEFAWAIISDQHQSMSGGIDMDLEELKDQYGDRFLVVRDGDERYVITDEGLVRRAERSASEIRKYGTEIGEIARTQARLSLSENRQDKSIAKLSKRRKALEKAIEVSERRRESTDDLEQDLFRIRVEMQALEGVQRGFALTSDERDDLSRRRDVAKERLQRGVRRIQRDMREILETAKSRGLAERVD